MTASRDGTADPRGGAADMMGRTFAFLAAGAVLVAAGWWAQPRFKPVRVQPEAERVLFPELTDSSRAASLEIVSFDDELAELAAFKVAKSGDVWVLPAHENYPADGQEQLAAAATELVDLKALDVETASPGEHATFGVIEPDVERVKVGMTGVGRLVEIRDAAGNRLARLVIGKEAKRPGARAEGGKQLRFVRKAGQDPVYVVEIDPMKFSTKFEDWIEKDLLKLSPWDVRRVVIDDSSCGLGFDEASGRPLVSQERRGLFELAYDDKTANWSVVKLESFDKGNKPRPAPLGADEELASGRLNELRDALGDLKIIDVARKPAGLGSELRAEAKFTEDREAVVSLAQRGFFPFDSGDILSSDGETVVGMKDGVEYVLRFGNGTTVAGPAAGAEGAEPDEPAAEAAEGETTGRYLFVMARFNDGLVEKPTLEPLPEVPAEAAVTDDGKAADPPGAADGADGEPAAAAEGLDEADDAEAKAQAAIEQRRQVEGENRRKQEDYEARLKAGRQRVRELNARFADWYYIVSDAEYGKIHPDRSAIVQPKSQEGPAN